MFLITTDLLYATQKIIGLGSLIFILAYSASGAWRRRFSNEPTRRQAAITLGLAGLAVTIPPILKHYALQSHIFELGILTNVSWNFLNGRGFYDSVLGLPNYLGDHWQPALALMAPVLWFWKSAAALVLLQSVFLILGGLGTYKLARFLLKGFSAGESPLNPVAERGPASTRGEPTGLVLGSGGKGDSPALNPYFLFGNRGWALFLALLYFGSPQLHGINRFDFHPEACAAALTIWGFYWLLREKPWPAFLAFIALWLVKEDLPVVTFGLGLYIAWAWPKYRRGGVLLAVGSVLAFAAVIFVLMPRFLSSATPTHMARYSDLGQNWGEIWRTLLLHPHRVIAGIASDPATAKGLARLILPFMALPLAGGWFFLVILMAWLPHLLSNYAPQRELASQYAAHVLPLLAIAAALGLKNVLGSQNKAAGIIKKIGPWPWTAAAVLLWAFGVTRYFKPVQPERLAAFASVIQKIPEDSSVSAQSNLGPHVAFRKDLRQFPNINNADYLLLDNKGNTWPVSSENHALLIDRLQKNGDYHLVKSQEGFLLFKKNGFNSSLP